MDYGSNLNYKKKIWGIWNWIKLHINIEKCKINVNLAQGQ